MPLPSPLTNVAPPVAQTWFNNATSTASDHETRIVALEGAITVYVWDGASFENVPSRIFVAPEGTSPYDQGFTPQLGDVVLVLDGTPPAVPSNLAAVPGDQQVQLTWDDNTEPDLAFYEYRVDAGLPVSTGLTSEALVSGLTNEQQYSFEVRASDFSGNASAWSAPVLSTPTSGGGFDPLTDITWHAVFWAEDPAWTNPGDGQPVSQWDDASGNARHLTSAGTDRPTFVLSSGAMNSKPIVRFTESALTFMDSPSWTALAQPVTFVCVFRVRADTTSNFMVILDGTDGTNYASFNASGMPAWHLNAGTTVQSGTPDQLAHLGIAVYDTTDELQIDGTVEVSGDAGSNSVDSLRVAASRTGSAVNNADVDVAFIGIIDGAITAQDRTDLETWAASHYGLTIA